MSKDPHEIVKRLTERHCPDTSHDNYDGMFCPECGHDAETEIRAALVEAVAEERKALREKLIEHGVSSSLAVQHVLDDLTAWLDAREKGKP